MTLKDLIHIFKRKRRDVSSYDVLRSFFGAREVEQLALAVPDRRELFCAAARKLGCHEIDLMQRIAGKLRLSVVERPQPMDLKLLRGCTVSDLRGAGAIVTTTGPMLTGVVCVDPARVAQLPARIALLPIHLGSWEAIARALDASERLFMAQTATEEIQAADEDRALVEQVLALLISNAQSFGADGLEVDCTTGVPAYRFRSGDGKLGSASLDDSLRSPLLEYFSTRQNGNPAAITALDGQRVALHIKESRIEKVFLVEWLEQMVEEGSPQNVVYLNPERGAQNLPPDAVPKKIKILVVDDNETFARVLERYLGRLDIEVSHTADGAAVLTCIQNIAPDLLICDVHLPAAHGAEVVQSVRKNYHFEKLPIVMLTSDSDTETEIRLLAAGADAFVLKSEDPRILCAHVQRLLVRTGKRREAA